MSTHDPIADLEAQANLNATMVAWLRPMVQGAVAGLVSCAETRVLLSVIDNASETEYRRSLAVATLADTIVSLNETVAHWCGDLQPHFRDMVAKTDRSAPIHSEGMEVRGGRAGDIVTTQIRRVDQ